MALDNLNQLKSQANEIRNANTHGVNTAERVGKMFVDIINSANTSINKLEQVRVYPIADFVNSVAEMLVEPTEENNYLSFWDGFSNSDYYWWLKQDDGDLEKGLYAVKFRGNNASPKYELGAQVRFAYPSLGISLKGGLFKIGNGDYRTVGKLTLGAITDADRVKLKLSEDSSGLNAEVSLPEATASRAGVVKASDYQKIQNAVQTTTYNNGMALKADKSTVEGLQTALENIKHVTVVEKVISDFSQINSNGVYLYLSTSPSHTSNNGLWNVTNYTGGSSVYSKVREDIPDNEMLLYVKNEQKLYYLNATEGFIELAQATAVSELEDALNALSSVVGYKTEVYRVDGIIDVGCASLPTGVGLFYFTPDNPWSSNYRGLYVHDTIHNTWVKVTIPEGGGFVVTSDNKIYYAKDNGKCINITTASQLAAGLASKASKTQVDNLESAVGEKADQETLASLVENFYDLFEGIQDEIDAIVGDSLQITSLAMLDQGKLTVADTILVNYDSEVLSLGSYTGYVVSLYGSGGANSLRTWFVRNGEIDMTMVNNGKPLLLRYREGNLWFLCAGYTDKTSMIANGSMIMDLQDSKLDIFEVRQIYNTGQEFIAALDSLAPGYYIVLQHGKMYKVESSGSSANTYSVASTCLGIARYARRYFVCRFGLVSELAKVEDIWSIVENSPQWENIEENFGMLSETLDALIDTDGELTDAVTSLESRKVGYHDANYWSGALSGIPNYLKVEGQILLRTDLKTCVRYVEGEWAPLTEPCFLRVSTGSSTLDPYAYWLYYVHVHGVNSLSTELVRFSSHDKSAYLQSQIDGNVPSTMNTPDYLLRCQEVKNTGIVPSIMDNSTKIRELQEALFGEDTPGNYDTLEIDEDSIVGRIIQLATMASKHVEFLTARKLGNWNQLVAQESTLADGYYICEEQHLLREVVGGHIQGTASLAGLRALLFTGDSWYVYNGNNNALLKVANGWTAEGVYENVEGLIGVIEVLLETNEAYGESIENHESLKLLSVAAITSDPADLVYPTYNVEGDPRFSGNPWFRNDKYYWYLDVEGSVTIGEGEDEQVLSKGLYSVVREGNGYRIGAKHHFIHNQLGYVINDGLYVFSNLGYHRLAAQNNADLVANLRSRVQTLEAELTALKSNTIDMEVTYTDDTTETIRLLRLPNAPAHAPAAPAEEGGEEDE